ncbi:MAG: aldehyde dehydrogenase [Coleofasciculaceae cyanobacterium SM2_1_6]|nr:aldehyde dehydrogenase [Coleofasciculaceae cyanobacterium SM2_1_6]
MDISNIVRQQRQFWQQGSPQKLDFRMQQLRLLQQLITENEEVILQALGADLRKPALESYGAEISLVLGEIKYTLQHLRQWVKPQSVFTPLSLLPGSSQIVSQPLGVVLIISPWNYPFQLLIAPLVGAIAAGNCTILKPSELAAHTSQLIAELIPKYFQPEYIAVVEGDKTATQALLAEKFEHIFFTGSTAIGKIIMAKAAETLTPVTLELGGKSPCIVDRGVDSWKVTARRIVWGKFINAGQTCVAPDYLLVQREIKSTLLAKIQDCLQEFYGADPAASADYCRIINDFHWQRLTGLLKAGKIVIGGEVDQGDRYIAPTVIEQITWDDPVMQEEIFGPILPVLEYENLEEAIEQINTQAPPLALYLFSDDRRHQQQVITQTKSGGVCLNDTILHLASPELPFGGVGSSGLGSYHGKASFTTFSHQKSILTKSRFLDLKFRYPPYTEAKLKLLKFFLG